MNQRVVSLSDRGRALEWLSLGFGLWLVAGLVFALLVADAREPAASLVLASAAAYLVAGAAIAVGLVFLLRSGPSAWAIVALASLAVVAVAQVLSLAWSIGAAAQVVLIVFALRGVRDLASAEGRTLPVSIVGAVVASEATRLVLLAPPDLLRATTRLRAADMFPWARGGLVAVVSVVSVGLLLLAIRAASAVVRAQIWAGEPGVTTPARAGDWQRTAAGLRRFGGFLIATISLDAATIPLAIMTALTGLGGFLLVPMYVAPIASALFTLGMVGGLVGCRRVPDPPDARAGFNGAAILLAALAAGSLYLTWSGSWQPLGPAVSSLGHLVGYLAVLRSVGRIGERLGDEDVTRRARTLGWLVAIAAGPITVGGFLVVHSSSDLGITIAVPMVVAAVVLAALLPCALLCRELAMRLRRRFAEPPRAVARTS